MPELFFLNNLKRYFLLSNHESFRIVLNKPEHDKYPYVDH